MLGSSRRGWRVLFGVTMGVVTAAVMFVGAPAANAATVFQDTVFQDTFSDGAADGWTLTGGAWAVAGEDGYPAHVGRGTGLGTIVQARLKPRSSLGSVPLPFHALDDLRVEGDVAPIDTTPPGAPGTPVASAITPNGFTLSWPASTDNVRVVGYQVITVVPPGSGAPVRVWTTGTSSITITDLPPRSTNTFQVRAFDAALNYSVPSPQITVTTAPPEDQAPPTTPGTPVASAVTATSVTLTWAAATDNVGVTAYYLRNPAGTVTTGPFTGTTAALANLAPSTTYTWVVVAVDAANNISGPSGQITVTTLADTPICEYSYRVVNQWQGGFQAEVIIRNISLAPVHVDRIHWTFANSETINNIWNAVVTITGSTVTIRPTWTVVLPPGGTFTFGFVGTGTPVPPNPIYLNGFRCRPL
jgi:chitodextrinase